MSRPKQNPGAFSPRRAILRKAYAALQARDFVVAHDLIVPLLKTYPTDGTALLIAAQVTFELARKAPIAYETDGTPIDAMAEAETFADLALAAADDAPFPDAHWARGVILAQRHRYEEALACYERASASDPTREVFAVDHGRMLCELGRYEEALVIWSRAPKASSFNRAMIELLRGNTEEGFLLYETRYQQPSYRRDVMRPFELEQSETRWQGEPLPGQRLLIYCEQGLGDALIFWRYLDWAQAAAGCPIILETHKALVRLAIRECPNLIVCAMPDPLPSWDRHCSILSLGHLATKAAA